MPQSLKRFLSNFNVVAIQNSLDGFSNTLYVMNDKLLIRKRCNDNASLLRCKRTTLGHVGRSDVIYQYRTLTYKRLLPTANVQYFMGYQLIVRKLFIDEIFRLRDLGIVIFDIDTNKNTG